MFEREKLSGYNFNDWFWQLKLVLRVEKKMFVIEHPIPLTPAADFEANMLAEWNAIYDAYNEVARLMLGTGVERFDLIQTFHACKQEEGKPVVAYVLKMKGYVKQLERLGYVLQQDLSVGLILNGLTSDFVGFVRNYNMHNIGKTIGELHAMLIEYEKGLLKKAEIPQGKDKQVYIPEPKNPKPSAKEHPAKDDTCHHCKEVGHWKRNCHVYLAKLLKKKKQASTASYLVSKDNVLYFNVVLSNDIYEIDMSNIVPNNNSIYNVSNKRVKHNLDSTYLWHCRLAHISKKRIEKLQQEGLLKSTNDKSFDQCVSCLSSKMTRKSFPHRSERATCLLGIIHTDVCGPLRHVSRQSASYFITFTDDYSRYGYVYLLKHKHKVFETFKVFKNEMENQLGKTIKALRSDQGGEYISQEFKDYLKACGILQQLTPPYTPKHNGVFERRNRTLLDMVRSMMNLTTLPLSFWDYAMESATRILNMVPTKKVDKTPYELWYGKVPNLSYLKVWGCEALVKRDTPDKLQQRSIKYAEFFEKSLITQEVSGRVVDLEEIQDEDTSPSEITSEILMEVEEAEEHSLGDLNEPTTYKCGMQSMIDNMVWVLVDLPPNSRLLSKGYTQLYGVDYEETFSPVTDIRAIRILISITTFYDYEIWKMDVKTAFLNGYLDEGIYMVQSEGLVDPKHPKKVCKLQRSIYGLKQASRSWNKRFDEEIKKFGFAQNLDEPYVYQKASGSNVTFLILYVDDIIIIGNHILSLQSVKDYLGKCFAMKDLGEAAFILGIKIHRDRSKRLTRLSQSAYMDKILKRYKMDNSKHMFLVYDGNLEAELRVDCYCDAGFETDRDDIKSQT
ncbi:retrotransposon protein, putative, ty1-copia subclass [Tanacetum coccineum]